MPAYCSVPVTYAKLMPNGCNVHQRMDKMSHTSAYVGAIRCGVSTPLNAYADCWFSNDAAQFCFHCRQSLKSYLVYDQKGDDSYSVTLMPCRYLHQRKDTKFAEDFALEVQQNVFFDFLIFFHPVGLPLGFLRISVDRTVSK